jgi:serine/threonine protein phosphatase PrpC
MTLLKSYAAETNQGPYLQINEDAYHVDLDNQLFMVFDGFGGSGIGDKCVDKLKQSLTHFYTRVNGDADATLPFFYSNKYLLEGNALINAIHYSHKIICSDNAKLDMDKRGGASAALIALSENVLTIVSIGNCCCYLSRKGKFEKIFSEDSTRLMGGDFDVQYFRTTPTSAFGLFDDIQLQVKEIKIADEDQVLILTDGVYSRLELDEIKYILDNSEKQPSDKIKNFFEIANSRGNLDNQSSMILKF